MGEGVHGASWEPWKPALASFPASPLMRRHVCHPQSVQHHCHLAIACIFLVLCSQPRRHTSKFCLLSPPSRGHSCRRSLPLFSVFLLILLSWSAIYGPIVPSYLSTSCFQSVVRRSQSVPNQTDQWMHEELQVFNCPRPHYETKPTENPFLKTALLPPQSFT